MKEKDKHKKFVVIIVLLAFAKASIIAFTTLNMINDGSSKMLFNAVSILLTIFIVFTCIITTEN